MTQLKKVRQLLEEYSLDAILVYNGTHPFISPSFIYIFQPSSGIFEGSALLITQEEVTLFTSKLEESAALENPLVKSGDILVNTDGLQELFKSLKKYARVGLEFDYIPVKLYNKITNQGVMAVDMSQELNQLRWVKEEWEIERIKKAIRVSEKALDKVINELDMRKLSESEIRAELEYHITKQGCGIAFDTIVAFDENAAIPHYTTGSSEGKGPAERVILIDFGARCDNYCADITRTFLLGEKNEIIEAYEAVLNAQLNAIDVIKEGIKASEPDRIARKIITEKDFPEYPHSLGHMLGILVHDGARLHMKSNLELKQGMVFTVEPGIYISGKFGIRIEDDIVVRKNRAEVLSSFPKDVSKVIL